jgi:hypothetical protein
MKLQFEYNLLSKQNIALFILLLNFTLLSFFDLFNIIQLINIIIFVFTFVFSVVKKKEIYLFLLIIYLLFFDINFLFTFFGDLHFRLWYFIVIYFAIKYPFFRIINAKLRFYSLLPIFLLLFGFLSLISFLFNGFPIDGLLFLSKNIFYFFLSFSFIYLPKKINEYYLILSFFISMLLFMFLMGLIQVLFFSINIDINYIKGTLRPHAFFPETTWFSQYGLFLFIISFMLNYRQKFTKLLLQVFGLTSIILSMSRNPIISLIVSIFLLFIFFRDFRVLRPILYLLPIAFIYEFIASNSLSLTPLSLILQKFTFDDDSIQGRLDSILLNLELLGDFKVFFFGSGFSGGGVTIIGGTSFGVRSYILPLAIISSLGIFALLFFILFWINFIFFGENIDFKIQSTKIGLVIIIIYFLMSMFSPFHFFPLSWFIISLGIILYKNFTTYQLYKH